MPEEDKQAEWEKMDHHLIAVQQKCLT